MAIKVKPETLDEVLKRLEVPLETFAQQVGMIADGMKVFEKSQLTYDTIIMLIARSSRVPQGEVLKVLEAISSLDTKFLKKAKP